MRNPFKKASAVPETKVARGYALHMQGLPKAVWSERNYGAFSREAYMMNVVAFQAINKIATAISAIDWFVQEGDERLDDHPMLDLVRRPNPKQTRGEWLHTTTAYLLLNGNSYEEFVMSQGRIIEIWPMRPDRMSVIGSSTGLPSGYEYKVGQEKVRYPANPITGESPIRHEKLFHPTNDWYGMSPIQAAAFGVDQHNEAMNWMQSLLQNSARPSGALMVDSEAGLSDKEFTRLQNEIETKYAGAGNAGRPMLLEGGLEWKAMGLSPMDMEILKMKDSAARDISLAFGVPPLLLNIPGDNTYANYREARLGFYEDTVLPFLKFRMASLNNRLSPVFGGAVLRPDIDSIEAVAEKRQQMWQMADESFDLTLNESRALKGFPPLPEPLGSTLMAEIRKGPEPEPSPEEETPLNETLKGFAYGPR